MCNTELLSWRVKRLIVTSGITSVLSSLMLITSVLSCRIRHQKQKVDLFFIVCFYSFSLLLLGTLSLGYGNNFWLDFAVLMRLTVIISGVAIVMAVSGFFFKLRKLLYSGVLDPNAFISFRTTLIWASNNLTQ